MNALWTIGERLVSERWTLCERWTRANGERKTVNDERTMSTSWTHGEQTVNKRKNGKVERFRDCTHWKVLSQGIFMWNIKPLALSVQKSLTRLKFSKSRLNFKVKVTVPIILVPRIGLITRNTTVKYQSFSNFISKVKFSERITK